MNPISEYIPELKQISVMWEEVSYGIGSTKAHLRDVYVVYTNEDSLIGAILEDNGGLGFSFGQWLNMCCEGTNVITPDRVAELITLETLTTHMERMNAIITLLNTSQQVLDNQKAFYNEQMHNEEVAYEQQHSTPDELADVIENDGQPTEQEEWEDIEHPELDVYEPDEF